MAQVGSNYEKNNWRSKILLDCPFKRKNKLSPYPDLSGYSVGGRGEHDEHVVERLQLQVISQQAPQHSQHALKLHLVLQLPRRPKVRQLVDDRAVVPDELHDVARLEVPVNQVVVSQVVHASREVGQHCSRHKDGQ